MYALRRRSFLWKVLWTTFVANNSPFKAYHLRISRGLKITGFSGGIMGVCKIATTVLIKTIKRNFISVIFVDLLRILLRRAEL